MQNAAELRNRSGLLAPRRKTWRSVRHPLRILLYEARSRPETQNTPLRHRCRLRRSSGPSMTRAFRLTLFSLPRWGHYNMGNLT
jgi:hypothetical protein